MNRKILSMGILLIAVILLGGASKDRSLQQPRQLLLYQNAATTSASPGKTDITAHRTAVFPGTGNVPLDVVL